MFKLINGIFGLKIFKYNIIRLNCDKGIKIQFLKFFKKLGIFYEFFNIGSVYRRCLRCPYKVSKAQSPHVTNCIPCKLCFPNIAYHVSAQIQLSC